MLDRFDFEISKCFRNTSLCFPAAGNGAPQCPLPHLDYFRILPWLSVRPCPTLGSAEAHDSESFVGVLQSRWHVVVVVSYIPRIGCQPEQTILHGGQSRSWSTEQGKKNKRKSLAVQPRPPTPPRCSFGEKKNKITWRIHRRYAGVGRSRVRTRIPSTRRLGQWVSFRKVLRFRVR